MNKPPASLKPRGRKLQKDRDFHRADSALLIAPVHHHHQPQSIIKLALQQQLILLLFDSVHSTSTIVGQDNER